MKWLDSFLGEEQENISTSTLILLMIVAYAFSIAVRLIWVYHFSGQDNFYWNSQLMINTNDGYYFASAVKSLLSGSQTFNPQIPGAIQSYPGMIYTTYFAVKLLPFSLESIILYMPAVVSSLVVIPIILIFRLYGYTLLGFFAALIGAIAWSYYNRTMVGYYDSDMFAVLLQYFIVYSLLSITHRKDIRSIFLAAFLIIIYPLFYPQGLSLIYAMFMILSFYLLFYHRSETVTYIAIAVISLSLIAVAWYVKLFVIVLLYVLQWKGKLAFQYWVYIAAAAFIFFLFGGNVFGLLYEKIFGYLHRGTEDHGLKFYQVIQTVREAGTIPFSVMANRISGSTIGVVAALLGYLLLISRHRSFVIMLPLIGIGIFSLWGGLRFTVYAVPAAAISAVFLFYVIGHFAQSTRARYGIVTVLTGLMLYPNITHIVEYKVPTVFGKEEVRALETLKNTGSEKDYIVAWWDYGYPLWFYAEKNTLIDGSKHHHDNFIVSEILSTPSQQEAASLARIAVETYVASDYITVADTLFKNHAPEQLNVTDYLDELKAGSIKIPKATRNVYFYLPFRMLDIFPTVKVFSNIDLNTGKAKSKPFFYKTRFIKDTGKTLAFGNGIEFDKQNNSLIVNTQKIPLNSIWTTEYDKNGKLQIKRQLVDMGSRFYMVYMKSYNQFLIMDREIFDSSFIQMMVLDHYDKQYFEPVILNPYVKIYRLLI